jgi:DNA polymerase II large subunit
MDDYPTLLRNGLQRAYAVAAEARKLGFDATDDIEVKLAKDVAARVEGIVGPPGVSDVIRAMEASGMPREDLAFEVAKKIAAGELMKGDKEERIEQAVRTGLGILTEGVLVAPTEGIAKVRIKQNPDGSDYVAVYYAGPIRSAGGTAAALSLVLADIARKVCGIGDYRATDSQIMRYIEEVTVYETRCVHLQYLPPEEDIRVISGNCPVCIDGEPTEEIEVSAYRGVPGVETDRVRGGVPLVMCEGVAAKSAKLLKYTKKLKLGWDWLEKIIKIKKKLDKIEIKPDPTYMEGLVAGRPVFSHPSAKGGFRLRYGRSKTNGLMAKNVHPATMILLDNFLAYGTHMKIERPGKGCVVAAHEGLEPPAVRLKSGRLMKVRTIEEAYAIKEDVAEILFLGDMLCTYGDFSKSNHPLIPSGYCEEWWERELESKGLQKPQSPDAPSLFAFSKAHGVPLHPDYTYHWHDITPEQLASLARWLEGAAIERDGERVRAVIVPYNEDDSAHKRGKRALEELIVEHRVVEGNVMVGGDDGYALLSSLGWQYPFEGLKPVPGADPGPAGQPQKPVLEIINSLAGIRIKAKAPTYIGARMGRPEKAKERKMDGSPHSLFPTGSFKNRSLSKQYRTLKGREGEKTINIELARMRCRKCRRLGFYRKCEVCGERMDMERICQKCGRSVETDIHCDMKTLSYDRRPVDIVELFDSVKMRLGGVPDEIKGVKGLTNPTKIPERLEKGVLRAKHDVYVFRDGTCRFDATDIPLTHFTPAEISLSLEKARELGYTHDYLGNVLEDAKQTVVLRHQDILLSDSGAEYLMRVAAFIDDMLVNLYGLKPFYGLRTREDLIGHLAVGLSPHTSAGVLCRIIGFTRAVVGYGHPYYHTAKRRNADGDEDCIMLLMDALINFSRKFLGEKRGGTMDAPLVLSIDINPKEVDDEAHSIEVVWKYPIEFYEAAERNTPPGEVKLRTVKDVLGTPEQFELPITHPGGTLDVGNVRTAYVELQSIPDKIEIQFSLQGRLRPVDKRDAAERLILSHFIPDLYGNLRSFSRQTFRCVSCNTIFRRVPLAGKCARCGGNLLLTINKGGIQKYLEISREIVDRYDLPVYLKQRLELVEREIKSIFEDDKIKQMGLSDFL